MRILRSRLGTEARVGEISYSDVRGSAQALVSAIDGLQDAIRSLPATEEARRIGEDIESARDDLQDVLWRLRLMAVEEAEE